MKVIFSEDTDQGYDQELLKEKGIYYFDKGDNYYASIADHYIVGGKYLVKYWCNNCFSPNLETIKLRYISKKK